MEKTEKPELTLNLMQEEVPESPAFQKFANQLLLQRSIAKLQECIIHIPEAVRTGSETEDAWRDIANTQLDMIRDFLKKL